MSKELTYNVSLKTWNDCRCFVENLINQMKLFITSRRGESACELLLPWFPVWVLRNNLKGVLRFLQRSLLWFLSHHDTASFIFTITLRLYYEKDIVSLYGLIKWSFSNQILNSKATVFEHPAIASWLSCPFHLDSLIVWQVINSTWQEKNPNKTWLSNSTSVSLPR